MARQVEVCPLLRSELRLPRNGGVPYEIRVVTSEEEVHPTGDAYDYTDSLYKKTGLVAHGQVQPWNRTDPGVYFPWSDVINAVSQRLASVPEPTTWALGTGLSSEL